MAVAHTTIQQLASHFLVECQSDKLRTMREWAEEEIILPNGPHKDEPYRAETQPYARLFFEAVESGDWRQYWSVGPTQSGKTLTCAIIPLLYYLFERRETVIFGVPDMESALDKWTMDILPVLEKTKYRSLLPAKGAGSRGGKFNSVAFRNGATLKFMTAGGGDKSRAAFTARVLVITEVEAFGTQSTTSTEANKLEQLLGRLLADPEHSRVFAECTATTEDGVIWARHQRGSCSRIALPCPHCGEHVTLERENLSGFEGANGEKDAESETSWYCSECGAAWTEDERRAANHKAVLLHQGQAISAGGIVEGDAPRTYQFSFRWSAINNLFFSTGYLGIEMHRRELAENEDSAERQVCQFLFATPYTPPSLDIDPLKAEVVEKRQTNLEKGVIPEDAKVLDLGIDIGLHISHWALFCGREGGRPYIPDYGAFEVPGRQMDAERAIKVSLHTFRESIQDGWRCEGSDKRYHPQEIWIDARYMTEAVLQFCKEAGPQFRPVFSFSTTAWHAQYRRIYAPKKKSSTVAHVGEGYHFTMDTKHGIYRVNRDADYWKGWVHQRFRTPQGNRGALEMFSSLDEHQHAGFVESLLSEKEIEEEKPGHGTVRRWIVVKDKKSHWLDALGMASAAAHWCGWRVMSDPEVVPPKKPKRNSPKKTMDSVGFVSR